jgi:hypothetical protein
MDQIKDIGDALLHSKPILTVTGRGKAISHAVDQEWHGDCATHPI